MDIYSLFGIDRISTKAEIKKKYYSLSKTHHPDAGGDPAVFQKISEAYTILMDDNLREKYDKGESVQELTEVANDFMSRVLSVFQEVISDRGYMPEFSDLFAEMNGKLNDKELRMKSDIEDQQNEITNLKEIKSRIKVGQIFIAYVESRINDINKTIGKIENEVEILGRIRLFIKDFSYEISQDDEDL